MDDGYDAWNNTSSQYDWPHGLSREQWADANWGLIHHAGTLTGEHHEVDGKIGLIAAEQGCKLWMTFFPKEKFLRDNVDEYFDAIFNCSSSEEQPRPSLDVAVGYTLVLLPGDCYFQPSGAAHAVYTPEPSFTRGSSFWSLTSMHQVEVSRLYDAEGGIWSTNLDHDPDRVYEGLVRLMLYLPTNPNKLHYKRSLASFLLMILEPELYIPTHRRAYGFPEDLEDPEAEEEALANHEQMLSNTRKSVKKCLWASLTKKYAKRVATFIGLPTVEDLKVFLGTGDALCDPGEKISIAGVLNEILTEQAMKREAEEEKVDNRPAKERPQHGKKSKSGRKKR
ncbi:hypothetical protein EV421DRAFT_1917378 [Armillaria borealis]|uniref:JmjC domain-containing protein n=1 Tax=Armillaria borealis TaxID=47425 RepID=A0AA39M5A7_9AGAR|nr:hypothetical protein EV421DRAFT_1917378 [Armillaria borealis]